MDAQLSQANPFMLMLNPEVVLAAVEKSERLSQLKSHLCRPLDKPAPQVAGRAAFISEDEDDGGDDEIIVDDIAE